VTLDIGLHAARMIAAAPVLAEWGSKEVFPAWLAADDVAPRCGFLRHAV